ncbi:MAG: nucleotide sugar dehydrogenase, partial [Gemmatimonadetes bacterium]|nr:nucleotide sugar dehydrogenase [Gemmatimonadota bacterium]
MTPAETLIAKAADRSAVFGVVGLGYVGLPLAVELATAGYRVLGFDINEKVVDAVNAGRSHVGDVPSEMLARFTAGGGITATTDMSRMPEADVVSICVPTPLSKTRDPDVSFVMAVAKSLGKTVRAAQAIVLESTTYPGTTRELLLPRLQEHGLEVGKDFFLAFSPERVDPGNSEWRTRNTPKVLGGVTETCQRVILALYEPAFDSLVPVSSPEVAELTKLLENTFRSVNIGLANEMAIVCDKLGVDVWEVIEAAATK